MMETATTRIGRLSESFVRAIPSSQPECRVHGTGLGDMKGYSFTSQLLRRIPLCLTSGEHEVYVLYQEPDGVLGCVHDLSIGRKAELRAQDGSHLGNVLTWRIFDPEVADGWFIVRTFFAGEADGGLFVRLLMEEWPFESDDVAVRFRQEVFPASSCDDERYGFAVQDGVLQPFQPAELHADLSTEDGESFVLVPRSDAETRKPEMGYCLAGIRQVEVGGVSFSCICVAQVSCIGPVSRAFLYYFTPEGKFVMESDFHGNPERESTDEFHGRAVVVNGVTCRHTGDWLPSASLGLSTDSLELDA